MVNYKKLRPGNLTSPEFRHLLLLLYWPVYGLMFLSMERFIPLEFTTIEIPLDRQIPFCEYFVFPYYFWFLFIFGMHAYTLFFDIPAFKKMMYFIMITYTVTILVYLLFPNKQELRPTEFPRENFCVDIVRFLYGFDTNTNVCPSLHVTGSFLVLFTTWECKPFRTPLWQTVYVTLTVVISISTVFLKQHSLVDIIAALILCAVAYPFAYILPDKLKSRHQN